jgi:hypothetical protein
VIQYLSIGKINERQYPMLLDEYFRFITQGTPKDGDDLPTTVEM